MRTTSIKTVYLTPAELKEAVASFVGKTSPILANRIRNNSVDMEWALYEEFAISIDGEIEDEMER